MQQQKKTKHSNNACDPGVEFCKQGNQMDKTGVFIYLKKAAVAHWQAWEGEGEPMSAAV